MRPMEVHVVSLSFYLPRLNKSLHTGAFLPGIDCDFHLHAVRCGTNEASRVPTFSYMWNFTTNTGLAGHAAPFVFPFRAITVSGAPNVLTAGKTIAMTFAANTAAREHLDEWSCGVGTGAAAALMFAKGWNSSKLLSEVGTLQQLLRSPQIAQPLSWGNPKPPGPHPSPSPTGDTFVCGAMRCYQSDTRGQYVNSSCIDASTGRSACGMLQANEWLLLKGHWQLVPNRTHGTARVETTIKKSEHPGSSLPPNEKQGIAEGTQLYFRRPAASADSRYWLAQLLSHGPTPSPSPIPSPPTPTPVITSHSPVFRWRPAVDRSREFSVVLQLNVSGGGEVWQSPPTWHLPSTGAVSEEVGGVAVYSGPELKAATDYTWSVEERSIDGVLGARAGGAVRTSSTLIPAREQAKAAVESANISKI